MVTALLSVNHAKRNFAQMIGIIFFPLGRLVCLYSHSVWFGGDDPTLMFADSIYVEIPNYIGIQYYVIMYFLPPFFIATTPPNMSTNSSDACIFRAIEKSTLKILISCDFFD
jgi:hypothetical protein